MDRAHRTPSGATSGAPSGANDDSLRLRVQAIRLQAEGIRSFELADPSGAPLPEVQAGMHLDVHAPGGHVRSYSLAGDPADRSRWILGVLLEPGSRGASRALHDRVHVGDLLKVGRPRQAFALAPDAAHSVLIAGGIGVTPLKSMAHALAAAGQSFELHYCARSAAHAAFLPTLHRVVPEGRLHLHFDGGDPARGLDLAARLRAPAAGTHLYYCGPAGFMSACAQASAHWAGGTVHSEHFKPPGPAAVGDGSAEAPDDGPFELHLARSGLTLQVPAGQTIVRAVELAGLRIPTSCLSGLCGSCKVDYLEGEVAHHDYILDDDEQRRCLTTCVSRARSARLVLDY